MNKNKRNTQKGITLIALIITIIVLLILAVVSIKLVMNSGIIGKSETATETYGTEAEKEQIKIAYADYKMAKESGEENTKLDVAGAREAQESDGSWTIKFEKTGNVYKLSADGKAITPQGGTSGGTPPATASAVNALIGQIVDYEEDSGEVDSWRVYYASDTEMFLISTNTVASSTAFGSSSGIPLRKTGASADYSGAADVFSAKTGSEAGYSYSNVDYGKTYNKLWFDTTTTDKNSRSKATAYLCDPANWTKYIGSNAPSGTYAVGGPTKELFIKSWNASIPQTGVQKVSLVSADVTANGYAYYKPDHLHNDHPILKTILPATENGTDGLYNNGASYWLASPSSSDTDGVCRVSDYGYVGNYDYFYTSIGVRPLVSIPMSKVQIEDGIVKIGN